MAAMPHRCGLAALAVFALSRVMPAKTNRHSRACACRSTRNAEGGPKGARQEAARQAGIHLALKRMERRAPWMTRSCAARPFGAASGVSRFATSVLFRKYVQ